MKSIPLILVLWVGMVGKFTSFLMLGQCKWQVEKDRARLAVYHPFRFLLGVLALFG
jgi:hypothetical protein